MSLFDEVFKPMLLSEKRLPFNDKDYIFEIKFDGMRALIYVSKTVFKIYSRTGRDVTYLFPELQVLQKEVANAVIFDGEIVSFKQGVPSFFKLQERIHLKGKKKIFIKSKQEPVIFIAFDILYFGKSLLSMPLMKRKEILKKFEDTEVFVKAFYIEEFGVDFFSKVKALHLEGIVAKKKDSVYEINTRTDQWIKIKNIQSGEFYVGGFFKKKSEFVFLVLLGEMRNNSLDYVGNVSVSLKNDLFLFLNQLPKRKRSPFKNATFENVVFVKPQYIVEVEFLERGKDGKLRHPVFKKIKRF